MSELLQHRFAADLEVRSGDDGRTVMGICCPFDSPTPITEWGVTYTEQFARGSYANTIASRTDRVKFLALHDRGSFPLGRANVLREDAAGLYGEFKVSKTERGDEALELIRDGALDGFSVGFAPVRSTPNGNPRNGDLVTRQEVRLSEVSAVSFPAYDTARITGVRSDSDRFGDMFYALQTLREANPAGLDLSKLDTYMGWAELARTGKSLSTSTMAELQGVLDLIATADRAVDEAQPKLATLMGVPNPDADEAAEGRAAAVEALRAHAVAADNAADTKRAADKRAYDHVVLIARRHRVAV
jgi:HK97 family phage prohead protease